MCGHKLFVTNDMKSSLLSYIYWMLFDIWTGNVWNPNAHAQWHPHRTLFLKPPKDNYNIENINAFTADIENVIHELNRKNSEILIAGDYNINLLNLDMRQAFNDFWLHAIQ